MVLTKSFFSLNPISTWTLLRRGGGWKGGAGSVQSERRGLEGCSPEFSRIFISSFLGTIVKYFRAISKHKSNQSRKDGKNLQVNFWQIIIFHQFWMNFPCDQQKQSVRPGPKEYIHLRNIWKLSNFT